LVPRHSREWTYSPTESTFFSGTITGRENHNMWKIKFEGLRLKNNIVIISREHITTLHLEEEEKP
jgi:hypothetical protein